MNQRDHPIRQLCRVLPKRRVHLVVDQQLQLDVEGGRGGRGGRTQRRPRRRTRIAEAVVPRVITPGRVRFAPAPATVGGVGPTCRRVLTRTPLGGVHRHRSVAAVTARVPARARARTGGCACAVAVAKVGACLALIFGGPTHPAGCAVVPTVNAGAGGRRGRSERERERDRERERERQTERERDR